MKRFAALSMLLVACQNEAPAPIAYADLGIPAGRPASRPVGTYVMVEPDPDAPRFGPGPQQRILYMNRNGGTYTQGSDNSTTNTSIVPNGSGTVSAWSYGDAAWNQLMDCVRDMYSRFDIVITETNPGSTPHIESVVGGTPGQVGQPSYVGGVAPVNGDCSVVERGIVYTFAGVYGGDIQAICETVAQESAHALGLDHEYLCQDPMTYLYGCGAKSFQDTNAQCGEDGPRTCMCGGTTQNSVQILYDVLGPAGTDTTQPAIDISSPSNGATVSPGFVVDVIASDNLGVERVELVIDGSIFGTDNTGPYSFTVSTIAAGSHNLEARAFDAAGNMSTDSITVNVSGGVDPGDECPSACAAGTHCEGGICVPDAPSPGDTGQPCEGAADCVSGICGRDGDTRLCTEPCIDSTSCPEGFECRAATGGEGVCWPGSDSVGNDDPFITGGCSTSGRSSAAPWAALILGAALLLVRRRK